MASRKKQSPVSKTLDVTTEALKLSSSELRTFNVDPRSVAANVTYGLENLQGVRADLQAQLPSWDGSRLKRLAALTDAFLKSAAALDEAQPHADAALANDIKTAWALRKLMLTQARGLVAAGLLPAGELTGVGRGRGPFTGATDCVTLARIFKKHAAALSKKTFITDAQVTQAQAVGERLQRTLHPKGARRTNAEVIKARDLRDRLYTLLANEHDELWGIAALAFGRARVDQMFPPVGAIQRRRAPHRAMRTGTPNTPAAPSDAAPRDTRAPRR